MVKPEEIRDRQKLANLITQWNSEHYDLFELSPPNEVFYAILVCIVIILINMCTLEHVLFIYYKLNNLLPVQVNQVTNSSTNFQNGRRVYF